MPPPHPGVPPPGSRLIRADADEACLIDLPAGRAMKKWKNPIDALRWLSTEALTSNGRWAGYVSYDLGYLFESIGSCARDDLHLPLFAFALLPRGSDSCELSCKDSAAASAAEIGCTFSRDGYEYAVKRVTEYIAAGDVFQVNLSQRFTFSTSFSPRQIHQRLVQHSPASFGALLDFGDFALVSNSPELFLRVDGRRITTRPIKGTRPLLPGMESELKNSAKDQAELNMIVDLERNDLGRICQIGSVRVSQPRIIEAHPTVYHGVATIEGMLKSSVNFLDLLGAMFPGGSVTGAPKIRAMQLIDELEPVRRGPYCGAIGYLDSDGSMQFNLAIRTMVFKNGLAHIHVGGGIVADSVPSEEYLETLVKAEAMLRAVGAK
jgi:para-aminobenzoate synthetase component 1